jgi:hypothetical protein
MRLISDAKLIASEISHKYMDIKSGFDNMPHIRHYQIKDGDKAHEETAKPIYAPQLDSEPHKHGGAHCSHEKSA